VPVTELDVPKDESKASYEQKPEPGYKPELEYDYKE
jgi:hypothetical protein